MNKLAFVICCKESKYIYECVNAIENSYGNEVEIIIVDSCSTDKSYFELKEKYNNVFIEDICNRNYEYGSIMHGFKKYNQYEKYVFIQDSLIIKSKLLEVEGMLDNQIFLFGDDNKNSGWLLDGAGKNYFYMKSPTFPPSEGHFPIAEWNCFSVNKNTFEKIISSNEFSLTEPPIDKLGSCAWERVWALIFIHNNIDLKFIDVTYFSKKWGNRQ